MITWRHAVTIETERTPGGYDRDVYAVKEVYFEGDKVVGWTERAADPWGESLAELGSVVEAIAEALTQPVIDLREWHNDEEPSR